MLVTPVLKQQYKQVKLTLEENYKLVSTRSQEESAYIVMGSLFLCLAMLLIAVLTK